MDTRTLSCDDVNVTELAQKDVSDKASLLRFMNIQVHISENFYAISKASSNFA